MDIQRDRILRIEKLRKDLLLGRRDYAITTTSNTWAVKASRRDGMGHESAFAYAEIMCAAAVGFVFSRWVRIVS